MQRVYPGLYLSCDPRADRSCADVQRMLGSAGYLDKRTLTVDGNGWALAAVSPPGCCAGDGPGLYSDGADALIWAGDLFLPDAWRLDGGAPQAIAKTILTQLQGHGANCLAQIDGSFCIAWFSRERNAWSICNDRWGLIPLFWWADHERLIVAPKARLAWIGSGTSLQVDGRGVADLLRTQNMLDDHTLITGVHWLEPARSLEYDGTGVRTKRYWSFRHTPQEPASYADLLDRFVGASRATIERMTQGQQRIVQGLSGGLDSRLFLAVSSELGRTPECYTSGFAFSEDMRFGRQCARAAGAPHTALLLNREQLIEQMKAAIIDTDGLHGAGHLAMAAPIAAHLAGLGGAVLIEGYLHGVLGGSDLPFDEHIPAHRPPHEHPWATDFLHSGGSPELISRLLRKDLSDSSLERWQTQVDDAFQACEVNDPLYRAEHAIIVGRSGRNDVLAPAMFRRHVLARHPACDQRMMDWYATTPARYRRGRQAYINVLTARYPHLGRIPRADGCSGMPLVRDRWAREWSWRREQLYGCWSKLRYGDVRRFGRDSLAVRAWAFDTCMRSGLFEPLLAEDARVTTWVELPALMQHWAAARRDPRQSVPLLSLLTVETMMRELESVGAGGEKRLPKIRFHRLDVEIRRPVLVEAV